MGWLLDRWLFFCVLWLRVLAQAGLDLLGGRVERELAVARPQVQGVAASAATKAAIDVAPRVD